MSALRVFNRDKPRSSITDLIDILCSDTFPDESYDNIPELVTSIGLQSTGPSEASRAIRKKIKHGDTHQKYRALVILSALVENGDRKFQAACMNDQLVDALKHLSSNPGADTKVRKKLNDIFASWNAQFKNDPSLSALADLYRQPRPIDRRSHARSESADAHSFRSSPSDKDTPKKREKERQKKKRPQFNFVAEKPQILASIASASQASSNLVNAIRLVNSDKESITANARVQDSLEHAKTARKTIVHYIQLLENEEIIGTLIETNDRVMSALQMYENLSTRKHTQDATAGIQESLNKMTITPTESGGPHVHPDLQDLSFAGLGHEQSSLPPPIQPDHQSAEAVWDQHRGSLSDFSDYESEEERQTRLAGGRTKLEDTEDPFADPFAD